ncbi:MAG: PAS domain-containing protein [Acidobacteriia bacterium]|nr:PAS domain-containing protein [Terriglobia bacterium]
MFSNLLDNPKAFRHLVEDLPVGIYIVDQDRRIRFWNHAAERLTGRLSHEVVGHFLEDVVQVCDRRGNRLSGENCPVTRTLSQRQPQQCNAFSLHKSGHRTAVRIRTRPMLEYGDVIGGATVLFEEAFVQREESSGPSLYGCLDLTTGIPSRRLTRAVLNECIAGAEESHTGFGLLRIRLLGLDEFRAKHGPQSVAPFLRTAAHTLRNSLDAENFLGCWGENEFLAVLTSASPMMVAMTADILWNLLSHSEVLWWGDRFLIEAEVAYTVARAGKDVESLLQEMKPAHVSTGNAAATGTAGDSRPSRG